jgi:hypothetical protein
MSISGILKLISLGLLFLSCFIFFQRLQTNFSSSRYSLLNLLIFILQYPLLAILFQDLFSNEPNGYIYYLWIHTFLLKHTLVDSYLLCLHSNLSSRFKNKNNLLINLHFYFFLFLILIFIFFICMNFTLVSLLPSLLILKCSCLYQVIFSNACWYGFSLLIIHDII